MVGCCYDAARFHPIWCTWEQLHEVFHRLLGPLQVRISPANCSLQSWYTHKQNGVRNVIYLSRLQLTTLVADHSLHWLLTTKLIHTKEQSVARNGICLSRLQLISLGRWLQGGLLSSDCSLQRWFIIGQSVMRNVIHVYQGSIWTSWSKLDWWACFMFWNQNLMNYNIHLSTRVKPQVFSSNCILYLLDRWRKES